MIRRKTWLLSERPDSYGKQRDQVHPPAKIWREIASQNRDLFYAAAVKLSRSGIAGPFYAYGSRAAGTFVESSDIDIAVKYETESPVFFINSIKIDLKETIADPSINYILIPIT